MWDYVCLHISKICLRILCNFDWKVCMVKNCDRGLENCMKCFLPSCLPQLQKYRSKQFFDFHQLSSPKLFLRCEISCEVWSFQYKTNFCQSLLLKSLEIRLFYRKLNSTKRENSLSVFHRNSSKCSNDQRGKLDWNWLKFYGERNTGLRAITAPS